MEKSRKLTEDELNFYGGAGRQTKGMELPQRIEEIPEHPEPPGGGGDPR